MEVAPTTLIPPLAVSDCPSQRAPVSEVSPTTLSLSALEVLEELGELGAL
jgi:hypothetical protein